MKLFAALPGVLALAGSLVALIAPVQIQVAVSVVNAKGAPVTGLRFDDFHVAVDGVVRPPDAVSPFVAPLSLIVLIDATASVSAFVLDSPKKELAKAIGRALGARRADRIRVGGFAATTVMSPVITTPDDASRAVDAALRWSDREKHGPSPIWDAVVEATDILAREPGRRVIVLLTDGRTTGNRNGFFDMLRRLMLANVTVAVIAEGERSTIPQTRSLAVIVRPDAKLQQVVLDTGGVFWADQYVQRSRGNAPKATTGELFDQVVAELRAAYAITFSLEPDNLFHRLAIQVSREGMIVHTPGGFVAAGPGLASNGDWLRN
jgi:Ca-activated chloride channel homolog